MRPSHALGAFVVLALFALLLLVANAGAGAKQTRLRKQFQQSPQLWPWQQQQPRPKRQHQQRIPFNQQHQQQQQHRLRPQVRQPRQPKQQQLQRPLQPQPQLQHPQQPQQQLQHTQQPQQQFQHPQQQLQHLQQQQPQLRHPQPQLSQPQQPLLPAAFVRQSHSIQTSSAVLPLLQQPQQLTVLQPQQPQPQSIVLLPQPQQQAALPQTSVPVQSVQQTLQSVVVHPVQTAVQPVPQPQLVPHNAVDVSSSSALSLEQTQVGTDEDSFRAERAPVQVQSVAAASSFVSPSDPFSPSPLPSPSASHVLLPSASAKGNKRRHSGRLLGKPNPVHCARRPRHLLDTHTGHYYFFSEDSEFKGHPVGWLDARNLCRERCMDLVSIETPEENVMIADLIKQRNLEEVWTSGRLCNFRGCDQPHLQPRHINGWFWSASGVSIASTNSTPVGWSKNPWSHTGFIGQFMANPVSQPDNAEYLLNPSLASVEACLAIHNDWFDDGVAWHDAACYRPKPFICEDSDVLVNRARALSPDNKIRRK